MKAKKSSNVGRKPGKIYNYVFSKALKLYDENTVQTLLVDANHQRINVNQLINNIIQAHYNK
jgi:hypothetical protein